MNRRRAVLVALVLGVFMGACTRETPPPQSGSSPHAAPATKPLRMGSFSVAVDYGPYLVAKNRHWFEEALQSDGYKVEYTLFQSLPPINEALATDRVDVVFEAEPPAIVGKAAGIDVQIWGLSCKLIQEILVPTKSPVKTAGQLKGKRIAVLAGTSSHYGLLKILNAAGVTRNDVEIVDMVPPDAKNAFETGRVDAWAVWPPWVEQEELAGNGRVLPGGDAVIYSIMALRGGFARDNPAAVDKILKTLTRAKEWMVSNPEEAQKIVSTELNVPVEVVQKAWPRHDWSATINEAVIADIEAKAQFLSTNGFIKTPVNARELIVVAQP